MRSVTTRRQQYNDRRAGLSPAMRRFGSIIRENDYAPFAQGNRQAIRPGDTAMGAALKVKTMSEEAGKRPPLSHPLRPNPHSVRGSS